MNKRFLLISFLFSFIFSGILAQQGVHYCGTDHGRSEWLKEYQKNPSAHLRSNEILHVPVQIHLVGTDEGSGFYPIAQLNRAFCALQESFEPTGIRFYMTENINYVYSTKLQYHETFSDADTTDLINFPDVVNVYIAEEAAGACGYAAYWSNTVVLAKGCIGSGTTTWAHEMGHVLSLPHPFSGNVWPEGASFLEKAPEHFEKVDGSNCMDAGDGFCDTPPDYLGNRWSCNNEGFSFYILNDPDSVQFRADGNLIMSYSFDGCASRFSDEQIGAMQAFVMEERPEYIVGNIAYEPVTQNELYNIVPANGTEIFTSVTSVPFSWDPIENATNYIIEIGRFSNFTFSEYTVSTTNTYVELEEELIPGQTYYWRVKASNPAFLCTNFSEVHSFDYINQPLAIANLNSHIQTLTISPNPVKNNAILNVSFDALKTENLHLSLVSLIGQKVYTKTINTSFGHQQIAIPTDELSTGLYYVVLENKNGKIAQKIIIQ